MSTEHDLVYLASCALRGEVPEEERVAAMDMEALFRLSRRHMLSAIIAFALEPISAILDPKVWKNWRLLKEDSVRRILLFDAERHTILGILEEKSIWHLPLKGVLLKDFYPKTGMRQMSDNDILYDASRTPEVKAIMEGLGFSTDSSFGRGVHDHYMKPPVCNFEMHRALFGTGHDQRLVEYYEDVKSRLLLNEGSKCGFHFSDEDFYVYLLSHEYKHYSGGGTGLRSLLDTYVYLKKRGEELDWTYIAGELDKLGIADFEAQNRSLALHLFGGEALTVEDQKMLDYVLSSGTYGTVQNSVRNHIHKYGDGALGKIRYVLGRLFLPMDVVRSAFPLFVKCPILLPFLPLYRVLRGNRKRLLIELRELKRVGRGQKTA